MTGPTIRVEVVRAPPPPMTTGQRIAAAATWAVIGAIVLAMVPPWSRLTIRRGRDTPTAR